MVAGYAIARATLRSLFLFLQFALIALYIVAFCSPSGRDHEMIPFFTTTLSIVFIFACLLYRYHKQGLPQTDNSFFRAFNVLTFGALLILATVASTAITLRAAHAYHEGICLDFSAIKPLSRACSAGIATVIISWLSSVLAMAGSILSVVDDMSGVVKVAPAHDRKPRAALSWDVENNPAYFGGYIEKRGYLDRGNTFYTGPRR